MTSLDLGTREEREALDRLVALLTEVEKRSGVGRNRAMARVDLPKRSYQYAFNPKPELGRIATRESVHAILDGLQGTPEEKARADKLLLVLQQWKERGAAPEVMLPAAPDIFAGREQDMEALLSWLAPGSGPAAAILKGMGGVGKTALARMAAEEAFQRGWYKGGVHYVDMRGFSRQGARSLNEVLGVFIGALSERAKVPETVEGSSQPGASCCHGGRTKRSTFC